MRLKPERPDPHRFPGPVPGPPDGTERFTWEPLNSYVILYVQQENVRLRSHLLEHIKLYFMYKDKNVILFKGAIASIEY